MGKVFNSSKHNPAAISIDEPSIYANPFETYVKYEELLDKDQDLQLWARFQLHDRDLICHNDSIRNHDHTLAKIASIPLRRTPIFVFGSNLAGRHGKGAAKDAKEQYGAFYGQGEGMQGNAYAIPTKDEFLRRLPLKAIRSNIDNFLEDAKLFLWLDPRVLFFVTPIGCGLAGYHPSMIAPFFRNSPHNVVLSPRWRLKLGLPFPNIDT